LRRTIVIAGLLLSCYEKESEQNNQTRLTRQHTLQPWTQLAGYDILSVALARGIKL
jgi:hypothetical protein